MNNDDPIPLSAMRGIDAADHEHPRLDLGARAMPETGEPHHLVVY